MAAFGPKERKWTLALIIVWLVGTGLMGLLLVFSLINPILAVALILAVVFGSNLGLRILARLSRKSLALYLLQVGLLSALVGLWIYSIITIVQFAIILIPVAVGYWILSWHRIWKCSAS